MFLSPLPLPFLPNQLLTDWHIQGCLHNDEKFGATTSSTTLFPSCPHWTQCWTRQICPWHPNWPPSSNLPNSGSLLFDCIITSPVQQSILASNTNLCNCKPLQAATNAFNRKINKYKDRLQLQPPGTKFLPLAIESLSSTHPEVCNFLIQLAQCASRFSLLSAFQSNASFVAYHAQALSVLTHVGTANSILDLAKKASTTFQLAAGTSFNPAIPL